MKKSFCLVAIVFLFHYSNAQHPVTDSVAYYQKELRTIYRSFFDSLRKSDRYREANDNLHRIVAASDNYGAFSLYFQAASADFDLFNAQQAAAGFSPFTGPMLGIGYGFSFKKNRRLFDLNVGAFGLNRKSRGNSGTMRTSFASFFQFEWGYDVLRSKKYNFYPFAGFGIRSSEINYKANKTINPSPTYISNVVQSDASVSSMISEFGFQAGLGFETVLTSAERPGGVILFVKAGTNRPFKRKTFSFEGFQFDPQANYGDWLLTLGFKFFGRR